MSSIPNLQHQECDCLLAYYSAESNMSRHVILLQQLQKGTNEDGHQTVVEAFYKLVINIYSLASDVKVATVKLIVYQPTVLRATELQTAYHQ